MSEILSALETAWRGWIMTWCPPFMVRPPEDTRRKIKKDDQEGPTGARAWKLLFESAKSSVVQAGQSAVELFKKKVETSTMPLEKRMSDARNARLSDEQVEELLDDSNPMVRLELAFNDSITGEVLERLKHDPDVTVSTVARRRLMKLD